MGFLSSVFNSFKRNIDESTVDYLDRVGGAVKDGNGDLSLVDEAEIYFAYGRIDSAMEIINEALRNNPNDERAKECLKKYSNFQVDENSQKFQVPKKVEGKRKYLVSVLANVDGNTFPQNFEIVSELDVKETKEGQDFLRDKINEQGYNSWGLLSVVELKG